MIDFTILLGEVLTVLNFSVSYARQELWPKCRLMSIKKVVQKLCITLGQLRTIACSKKTCA